MSKPEWGAKRVCPSCDTRFYDMCRQPITCPKCEAVFDPDVFTKKKRGRPPAAEAKTTPKPSPREGEEELDIDLDDELSSYGETDEVLEDTSDFGEDEKVVEIEPNKEE